MSARLAMSTRVTSARAAPAQPIATATMSGMWRFIAGYYARAFRGPAKPNRHVRWHTTAQPAIMRHHDFFARRPRRVGNRPALPGGSAELPGTRLSLADSTAHRRGTPCGRRLLVARREAARFSERARTRQPVLSNLRGRLDDRRYQAHFTRPRQDNLRLLPAGDGRDRVCVHACRSQIEAAAGRGAGDSRVRQGAPLLVGLRPRDGYLLAQ